jgi:hypothetical protein
MERGENKMNNFSLAAAASAVVLLMAGCGGDSAGTAPSLTLSGIAATGAALAGSAVEIKCASGSGTATTNGNGAYTRNIAGAMLPCMIQVTGTADGVTVKLHSVTESGTVDGTTTSAVANVTPLTEMIVAQLTGTLPTDLFDGFNASEANQITTAGLTAATDAVVTALKDATGIDLGSIDPFKSVLIAATGTTAGNTYDQLLDALKEKVSSEALPLVVNQIASAANTTGETAPITLADVMTAVDGGSLPGCPAATSGKYRTIAYWGQTFVRQIDFKTMKFNRGDGQALFDITADPEKPCEFTAAGEFSGVHSELTIVIGASGAGAYRAQSTNGSVIGYIFPVQAHALSAIGGTWSFMQSGYMPGDGVRHFPGQITFNANNTIASCDYDAQTWGAATNPACVPADDSPELVTTRSDGGFNLGIGEETVPFYAYRAPNGSLTLFGTTNPGGVNTVSNEQTSFVAAKLPALSMPTAGTVSKYWDLSLSRANNVNSTGPVGADSLSVTTVDAANQSFTRTRTSDGRVDTVSINRPVSGMRVRPAGSFEGQNFAGVVQMPLPGLGIVASVNSAPSTSTFHLYSVSLARP